MYILIRCLRSMITNPSVLIYLRRYNLILIDIGLELRAKPRKVLFLQIPIFFMEFVLSLDSYLIGVLRGRFLASNGCIPGKYDCTLLIDY